MTGGSVHVPEPARRAARDTGAALLLVLGLVAFVGLLVSATLTYASTSLEASAVLADHVQEVRDVDGALQAGVNQVRESDLVDGPGGDSSCPGLTFPGARGDVRVTCEPEPGSGALAHAVTRAPEPALLATGQGARAGEDAVLVRGGGSLVVAGATASNSTIDAGSGSVVVDGAVRARRGCTGDVRGDPRDCSSPVAAVPSVAQPTDGFVRREVPACPGNGATIAFQPGYYDDAEALSALMASCHRSTFWFPGAAGGATYYFDFRNGEAGGPTGERVWRIADSRVRVVGGGTSRPGRPATVQIPGSCASPVHVRDNAGVQFVFGGDSRLAVTAGQVELCGPGDAAGGAPPVAIFGADTEVGGGVEAAAGPATPPRGSRADAPGVLKMTRGSATDPPSGSAVPFGRSRAQKDRIVEWDGRAASARIDGSRVPGGQRAEVRVGGFVPAEASPSTSIPPGSVLTFANLYVRHRETRIGKGADPVAFIQAAVVPTRAGATQVGPIAGPGEYTPGIGVNEDADRRKYRTDVVDLLATDALQDEVTEHGFTGATVEWVVESTDDLDLTAYLDSVQVAIGWVTPVGLRTQGTPIDGANCVGAPTTAYPGAGACALVATSDADGRARVHVQGTVHAPRAAVDLRHADHPAAVVAGGMVVRQLTFGAPGRPDRPVITVPRPLRVLLRAFDCPTGSCPDPGTGTTPSPPWRLSGTATVRYGDPGGRIVAGTRSVAVETWSVTP